MCFAHARDDSTVGAVILTGMLLSLRLSEARSCCSRKLPHARKAGEVQWQGR